MKHLTAATTAVALSLALVGCGSDNKTSTATSTSTSTTTTSSATSATPGAQAHKTIADYIRDNHITETPVHQGDRASPTIDMALPDGWKINEGSGAAYDTIVLAQPFFPSDPPPNSVFVFSLTGDVQK